MVYSKRLLAFIYQLFLYNVNILSVFTFRELCPSKFEKHVDQALWSICPERNEVMNRNNKQGRGIRVCYWFLNWLCGCVQEIILQEQDWPSLHYFITTVICTVILYSVVTWCRTAAFINTLGFNLDETSSFENIIQSRPNLHVKPTISAWPVIEFPHHPTLLMSHKAEGTEYIFSFFFLS